MPLYEYECQQCHRRTEKIQKFSDPELTACPLCGGLLARTVTAPAIQFKGAGWYKDLYSSAKPPAANAGGGEGGAAANTGGEGNSASAAKTDTSSAPTTAPASAPSSTPAAAGTASGGTT